MEVVASRTQTSSHSLERAENCVQELLLVLGENPFREGLLDTPKRVVKAMLELCEGYHQTPADILTTQFTETCDEMVVVTNIPFWSLCEHHMLPFQGVATVGYLPQGKIVGLSKIPRLVQCFARRLQVQERLTQQIAHELHTHTQSRGTACVIKGQHTCMQMRGIKSSGEMTTSCLLGTMREEVSVRAEFLSFVN